MTDEDYKTEMVNIGNNVFIESYGRCTSFVINNQRSSLQSLRDDLMSVLSLIELNA